MKKLLSLLLVAAMLLCWVPGPISADAAEDSQKLYLKPNSNWLEANARFAIYHWDASGDAWADITDAATEPDPEVPTEPSEEETDTTELEKAIAKAKSKKEKDYTKKSWAALEAALKVAEQVLAAISVIGAAALVLNCKKLF